MTLPFGNSIRPIFGKASAFIQSGVLTVTHTNNYSCSLHCLPTDLVYRLLLLQKEVNVLTNRLHVVARPERGTWCLRWRESDELREIKHRSINLGSDPRVAEAVKQLIIDWRNWKTPLYDLMFPGQTIPPEFWGIDWYIRAQVPLNFSPLSTTVLKRINVNLPDSAYAPCKSEKAAQDKLFESVREFREGQDAIHYQNIRVETERKLKPLHNAMKKELIEALHKGKELARQRQAANAKEPEH